MAITRVEFKDLPLDIKAAYQRWEQISLISHIIGSMTGISYKVFVSDETYDYWYKSGNQWNYEVRYR